MNSRLADLTYDTPFRHAFVLHVGNLQNLLNSIFEATGEKLISQIKSIGDPHRIGTTASKIRSVIFDIHCELEDGSFLIVELQRLSQVADIADRLVGYSSCDYATQWKKGDNSGYALVPVRVVAVLGFVMSSQSFPDVKLGSMLQSYWLQLKYGDPSDLLQRRFCQLQQYYILQLPLAPASADLCTSDLDRFAVLLRDAHLFSRETVPEPLQRAPFRAVVDVAFEASLSAKELTSYNKEREADRDLEAHTKAEAMRADAEKARADKAEKLLKEANLRNEKLERQLKERV